MSMRFAAERYDAYRIILRISAMNGSDMRREGRMLAAKAESVFGTDGSNLTLGEGYWKNDVEVGATVEIVSRRVPLNEDMQNLSQFCNLNLGLSCFATVETVTAYELYELAE